MTYQELIENTIVPSDVSIEEKTKLYDPVTKAVNQKMPIKLYRFRSCSERSMSAFMNDELWFSNGSTMNDDFDARIYYDKTKILDWIDSAVDKDGNLIVFSKMKETNQIPVELMQLPNIDSIFDLLRSMSGDQTVWFSTQMINYIKNNLDKALDDITNQVQAGTKFACFSEKICSDMMWGHYANNATGFAIEYDFGIENIITYRSEDDQRRIIWGNLFPIIYGNQRIDATKYAIYLFQWKILSQVTQARGIQLPYQLLNTIIPCPDEFMVTKVALKKSSDWAPEQEWRMFFTTNDMSLAEQEHSFVKQKPSAVYLGRKISDFNQKIIIGMAKEKDIPVFKMDFNENEKDYKLGMSQLIV